MTHVSIFFSVLHCASSLETVFFLFSRRFIFSLWRFVYYLILMVILDHYLTFAEPRITARRYIATATSFHICDAWQPCLIIRWGRWCMKILNVRVHRDQVINRTKWTLSELDSDNKKNKNQWSVNNFGHCNIVTSFVPSK